MVEDLDQVAAVDMDLEETPEASAQVWDFPEPMHMCN